MNRPPVGWIPFASDMNVASVRLRCVRPITYLRRAGWDCEICHPERMERYAIVVFQKAYSVELLELAKRFRRKGVKIVLDLCDNHFYNPRQDPRLAERAARLQQMIEACDAVSVPTSEMALLIENKSTYVIDDTLDEFIIHPIREMAYRWPRWRRPGRLELVWFGNAGSDNPSFGLAHITTIVPTLERFALQIPLRLTVISNSRQIFDNVLGGVSFPCTYKRWEPRSFPYIVRQNDICVIPIEQNPFTVCKTANRLAQSLLLGVPVIADPIPSFLEFSAYVLFSDWLENLHLYATDRDLREKHVQSGGAYVRAKYTSHHAVEQWSGMFDRLLP